MEHACRPVLVVDENHTQTAEAINEQGPAS